MTGNDNRNGNPGDRRAAGSGEAPSYAPTDPGWITGDFSSLDLGHDLDTSPKPVRRLDLPPLADAVAADNPSPSGDRATTQGSPPPGGVLSNDNGFGQSGSDDLGVFGRAGNDREMNGASMSSWSGQDQRSGNPPESADFVPMETTSNGGGEPKQGAPPHPLSGVGPAQVGSPSDRTQVYQAPAPSRLGSEADSYQSDPYQGFGADPGFGDQFSHSDGLDVPSRQDWAARSPMDQSSVPVERAERNLLVPGLGALALLLLIAGYFLFVRGDSDSSDTFAADESDPASDLVEDGSETGDGTTDDSGLDSAPPGELADNLVLSLAGAAEGPLETDTEYEMTIDGVPAGAQYLVVVDDLPQEPALDYLPVLILPEGRHTLRVDVTAGGSTVSTNPVDVYVLAPSLTATYRANLSSVNMAEQGWAEALRQFDEFRAAGHDGVMLSPSDPYPSLLPGFWNLYVPGFANNDEALAYCNGAGLAVPDECFPAPFDPDGPPRDG